jgi:hypothetical protein
MTTKTRPGPLAALFDQATYDGARLSQPDSDALVAEGVKVPALRSTFRRRLSGWRVSIDVDVALAEGGAVRRAGIVRNAEPTPEIIAFWEGLLDRARQGQSQARDEIVAQALALLARP